MSALKDNPDNSFLNDPLLGDSSTDSSKGHTSSRPISIEDDLLSEPKKETDENYELSSEDNSKEDSEMNSEENDGSESKADSSNDSKDEKKTVSKKKSEYDPYRVRDFLIRLAKAIKRHEIRSGAHRNLHEHIDRMQKTMTSKRVKSNVSVDTQINELRNKVAELIAIERSHATPQSQQMKGKVEILEGKLNTLLQSKQKKDERFKELERKITSKYSADQELVQKLDKKLLFLERKLIEHQLDKRKSKAKIDKKSVDEIKQQINTTKAILKQHKIEV